MGRKVITKVLGIILLLTATYFLVREKPFPSVYKVIDITYKIKTNPARDYSGATLVNLDDDPAQEIIVSGYNTPNLLLKMIQGKLKEIQVPELSDENGATFSVTACDLDQDGRDEILLINHKNQSSTFSRIVTYKNGKWIDILSPKDPLTNLLNSSYSGACIDRKGHGHFGLAITHQDGKLLYLEMIDSKIVDIADKIGMNINSKGRSILGVPGPLGLTNIFVGNEGANFYFVNQGDGTFVNQAKEMGVEDKEFDTRGVGLIDLNHDDIIDLVYGNHFGPVRLLTQGHDGTFKNVTPVLMLKSYAVNATVVGDFNLDGYEDLYLNNIRNENTLFARNEESWFKIDLKTLGEKNMFGVSTIASDLDENGSYEILNTHGDGKSFPLTLYNVENEGNWIKFDVKYTNGGIPRGSILKLRTNIRDQLRVVSSGSGRFANYGRPVIFGLLKNENILSLEVTSPSGFKILLEKNLKMKELNSIILTL